MARINIELDEGVHKALRKKAIDKGLHLADAVREAIEMYVKKGE